MIEVNNLTTISANEGFFKKVAKKVLDGEKKRKLEISIAIVGEKKIKELNKKYRKKNQATDVLSFFYGDSGEVVLCLQQIRKNAKKYKSTFKKESARVLIHGILHLLGEDNEKTKRESKRVEETKVYSSPFAAARVMAEKENYYLKLCRKIL